MESRLLFLRIKNNYTQSFVSNYIHCSQSAYSRYGEYKIFCVNEKIHTKKEVPSVE